MGCICSRFYALTQEMINLVGFKEEVKYNLCQMFSH